MKKKIIIVILTYNSQHIIKNTILSAKKISKNIIIVDSFSKDNTLKIVKSLNCKIIKRKFISYSNQRNFIIKKLNKSYEWQLHIDSDEIITNKLAESIKQTINLNNKNYAYLIKRKVIFMKKQINFGGAENWHLRLFPSGKAIVEKKIYDQHFISKIEKKYLSGYLKDHVTINLSTYILSHNRWSSLEAKQKLKNKYYSVKPSLFGNSIERKRFFKILYNYFPFPVIKPILLFLYKYFLLLGFLDGKIGFYYCLLNSLWFRTIIEAKKYENKL